jgi:hypothetical protein
MNKGEERRRGEERGREEWRGKERRGDITCAHS